MPAGEDTDMPSHVEEAEEILDREEDDGVKLEPFNLAQERAEGHFDESGHYVENKKDDAEETDAWLGSDDGKQVLQHLTKCETQTWPALIFYLAQEGTIQVCTI